MKQQNSEDKNLNIFFKILLICSIAVIAGFFGCIGYRMYKIAQQNDKHINVVEAPVIDEGDAQSKEDDAPQIDTKSLVSTADISPLIESVMPSIVRISCTSEYTYYSFFGMPEAYESTSEGTGFFVSQNSSKLYIATNNHVVDGASALTVTFVDETSAPAEIVGTDSQYDLAVISVNIDDLSDDTINSIRIASIGDSDDIAVGSLSVAIGNALGYGQSTTVGYISAVGRDVTIDGITKALVQTDAAINPGNSGGPLLNLYGQVIGINSIKYASEDVEGMGYAIPINDAVPIINDLIGYVTLADSEIGYIGIEGKDISQNYSVGFNMPMGVYVYAIAEGSPAASSELREGDIITKINNRSISTMEQLSNRISHIRAGSTVTLTVQTLTNGKYVEHEISIVLAHRPD